MKKFLLITSCLLALSPMSYAMDPEAAAAQEKQRNGRLAVKKTLEIPYEKTIFLPNGAGQLPFPVKSTEFTQKNVDVTFSFDDRGRVQQSLLFPAEFPYDLQFRIFTAFNDFGIVPEEPNSDGFGCLSGSVTDGRETIVSYTERPILSWEQIARTLLALKAQAYTELLALRDGFSVPVAVSPRRGVIALPLAVIDEESASSGDESSSGDEGENQSLVVATPFPPLKPTEVLAKVTQTRCPSLSNLRGWLKGMGATVTTKERKRKIKQLNVTIGDHSATFSSRADKPTLRWQVLRFLKQVSASRE